MPSHVCIPGNEAADNAAEKALELEDIQNIPFSQCKQKTIMKRFCKPPLPDPNSHSMYNYMKRVDTTRQMFPKDMPIPVQSRHISCTQCWAIFYIERNPSQKLHILSTVLTAESHTHTFTTTCSVPSTSQPHMNSWMHLLYTAPYTLKLLCRISCRSQHYNRDPWLSTLRSGQYLTMSSMTVPEFLLEEEHDHSPISISQQIRTWGTCQ